MRVRSMLGPLAGASLVGCAALFGSDDLSSEGPADAREDASTTDSSNVPSEGGTDGGVALAPTCDAPSKCMKAPAGFDGPFAVFTDGTACPPPFARSWERIGAKATEAGAPPAECTCSCGALTGTCAATMHQFDSDGCGGQIRQDLLTAGVCRPRTSGVDGFRATAAAQGQCPPDASTTVVALDAGTLAVGCSPVDALIGCADGLCIPPLPKGARFCVRPGTPESTTCPAEFPETISIPAGVEDTRGCTKCTCVATPACSFSYRLFDGDDCTGSASTFTDLGCHSVGGVDSFQLLNATAVGACSPSGGTPTGTVSVQSVSTVCCAP